MSSEAQAKLAPRLIRGVNYIGLYTLIKREVGRFTNVYMQTLVAPVVTTLLFYTVFALAFGGVTRQVGDVPFLAFLAPGLIMMTMVQNAFANTSSSLVIAKVQGNIVDILMPPLSEGELMFGYIIGGVLRGVLVGLVTGIVMNFFVPLAVSSWLTIIVFAMLGNVMLAALGTAAGIWSDKFDHMSAVTNFIITPLTFLSGTFYSIESLPEAWRVIAHYNPFFYMIDGFRSGFIGQADGSFVVGLIMLSAVNIFLLVLIFFMLRSGYKMKS